LMQESTNAKQIAFVQLRSKARTSGLNVRRHILSKERI